MNAEPRRQLRATTNWKCPLCDQGFRSENEKDVHMANACKSQVPVSGEELRVRRSSAVIPSRPSRNLDAKQASSTPNLSLSSKVPVSLIWNKLDRHTGEREVYFFDKNGEMYQLVFSENGKSSSRGYFKCDCLMEVGEHEGSLNVADLGVFDVISFKVARKDGQQIVIKLAGLDKELHNGARGTGQTGGSSHSSEDSKMLKEKLRKAESDVKLLTKANEEAKEELKRTEEKHREIVRKLKARIAEKDKEMSHRDEELRNAQDELGRFSEKSQAIMDRHGADKSKHEESLLLIEGYRKKIDKQKDEISKLQLEVKNREITQIQSDAEQTQLELDNLRRENSEFIAERETIFSQIDQIKKEKDKLMRALTTQSRNDSSKRSQSYSIGSGEQVQELTERIRELESECKEKEGIIHQLSSVENQDLQRKCSLLEKELSQLKSDMSIGNVYESNLETIREKESMLERVLREKTELVQQVEELQMDLTLKTSEGEDKFRGLEEERRILLNKISFRDTETGDLRQEIKKMKSELTEARRILASNFNSQREAEELVCDDEKSTFSISQSLGPEFKRGNVAGYSCEVQSSPGERQIKELSQQVKVLKENINLYSKENESLKRQLRTTETERDSSKQKLVEAEENLSATQTYLDEAQYLIKEPTNKTDIPAGTISKVQTKDVGKAPKKTKYTYTTVFIAKKKTTAYTLSQVETPEDYKGEIVLCRFKTQRGSYEYVAGTLQTIIHLKPVYGQYYSTAVKKTIAGIEFVDPLGNSDGAYELKRYFTTKPKHALFLYTDQVYIPCEDAK